MKSTKKNFIIFLLISFNSFSQITYNPKVDNISSQIKIESVEVSSSKTLITILCTEKIGSFFGPFLYFPSSTMLYDYYDNSSGLRIRNLGNDRLDTKYSTTKNGNYRFKLEFPPLLAGVEKITVRSFIRNQQTGKNDIWFIWQGISIENPKFYSKSKWDIQTIQKYLTNESNDPIEGIYERIVSGDNKYKLAVLKAETGYNLIYLSSNSSNDFKEGDFKAFLSSTASPSIFQAKWIMADRSINSNLYVTFSPSFMEVNFTDESKQSYLKLFPAANTNLNIAKKNQTSGTGFLISKSGFIVTNHHVVEGANIIEIRGINGDFSKTIRATVFLDDKNNDITILKTIDSETPLISELPFNILNKISEPGSSVFCLGYPLRATMGEEVKITSGIISSNSGFMGDLSSYQISAPIQPGNSGGPLFDEKGNVVGIITAKHLGAENVSYAIKSVYIHSLINAYPNQIVMPKNNSISTLSLPEKIKYLKKYTLIIETK